MTARSIIVGALALAFSVSIAGSAFAGPGEGGRKGKGKGPRGEPSPEFIKKYDKDGDGKLSDEERAAAREDRKKNRPAKGGEAK